MFTKRKLSPDSVTKRLAVSRFFFIQTLKKARRATETPYPKRVFRLPTVLSHEEVAQLINSALNPFHHILLMTLYATGARRAELAWFKISDIDSQRMVIRNRAAQRSPNSPSSCRMETRLRIWLEVIS